MKRVCLKCFQRAIAYQAPEVWLRFLALYPRAITEDEPECGFHHSEPDSARDSEILMWMFDALDNNREPA